MPIFLQSSLVEDQLCLLLKIVHFENFDEKGKTFCYFIIFSDSVWMSINFNRFINPWTATILGHDEEIYSTEAVTEIPIC